MTCKAQTIRRLDQRGFPSFCNHMGPLKDSLKRNNIFKFIYHVDHSGDGMEDTLEDIFLRKSFGEGNKLYKTQKKSNIYSTFKFVSRFTETMLYSQNRFRLGSCYNNNHLPPNYLD